MKLVMSAGYVLCLCMYTLLQIRRLWGSNEKREAWIYALFMTVTAVIGALLIAGVEVPSLVVPYKFLFEPLGKMILSP
ncbi:MULTISPECIES: hypothetical protein [unclassified Paenibacillus]|uniref:hypothetical protein n=1 Tax=unclassified Paenibacillus TaxID=185978 RepID=UPI002782D076|nr:MULTISPECIES: hypothetical protein [unclassified Paenibacillus]MDQ0901954.1 hypothetical protein [Paenibacillus sp. V4I7]MDQ0919551.1 hypothetical protein [Paenibacillus sp. V4I5]